jgi:hypothetical protein
LLLGAIGAWKLKGERVFLALALMMVVFFQAARMALVVFDPYLSSRLLAEALLRAPKGQLIVDDQYYAFSSIFFYTDRDALLLNGRVNNLEYGSNAPTAPHVFIQDADLPSLWTRPERSYLAIQDSNAARVERLVGRDNLHPVASSGGKTLYSSQPLPRRRK